MGDLRADLEARMLSGEPFTYGELCRARPDLQPGRPHDDDRLVDRTIQKLRKRGLIEWRRENGKGVVWRAVAAHQPSDQESDDARNR